MFFICCNPLRDLPILLIVHQGQWHVDWADSTIDYAKPKISIFDSPQRLVKATDLIQHIFADDRRDNTVVELWSLQQHPWPSLVDRAAHVKIAVHKVGRTPCRHHLLNKVWLETIVCVQKRHERRLDLGDPAITRYPGSTPLVIMHDHHRRSLCLSLDGGHCTVYKVPMVWTNRHHESQLSCASQLRHP